MSTGREFARDLIAGVMSKHDIECTGPGEVTCRGCREAGWMSWSAYRSHVADAIADAMHIGEEPDSCADPWVCCIHSPQRQS